MLLILPVFWLFASASIVVAVTQAFALPELVGAILLGITLGLSVAFGVVAIIYALRRL